MNYDDSFETNIFKHIKDGQTGTILIATKNNKSCQVTLENGEIIAVSMGRVKGYEAANELATSGIKRAAFTRNMSFPHTKDAFISSTDKFVDKLIFVVELSSISDITESNKQSVAA